MSGSIKVRRVHIIGSRGESSHCFTCRKDLNVGDEMTIVEREREPQITDILAQYCSQECYKDTPDLV